MFAGTSRQGHPIARARSLLAMFLVLGIAVGLWLWFSFDLWVFVILGNALSWQQSASHRHKMQIS
jgi:hypothetical protein